MQPPLPPIEFIQQLILALLQSSANFLAPSRARRWRIDWPRETKGSALPACLMLIRSDGPPSGPTSFRVFLFPFFEEPTWQRFFWPTGGLLFGCFTGRAAQTLIRAAGLLDRSFFHSRCRACRGIVSSRHAPRKEGLHAQTLSFVPRVFVPYLSAFPGTLEHR